MISRLEDVPRRIFLDSSALQTLQTYGAFLYENEEISANDKICKDHKGIAKLEALRCVMRVSERAPFQFAVSRSSFIEVEQSGNQSYLQWAYDVLDHWLACLEVSNEPQCDAKTITAIDTESYNYLGQGDRKLLRDALLLECDAFLTMENKLPKCAKHIRDTLGIQVLTPIGFWEVLQPWAALFY